MSCACQAPKLYPHLDSGDDEIADAIRRTLETTPASATHWWVPFDGQDGCYAPSTIHRIWRAFGLQPHRTETFKLSNDPLFVEKVPRSSPLSVAAIAPQASYLGDIVRADASASFWGQHFI